MFPKPKNLIRITSPFFVAGIEWNAFVIDKVTHYNHRCTPIVRYMCKWDMYRILLYCAERNWKWEIV